MRYLSLFSGVGGFELGIQQAYESNNKHACKCKKSKQKECTQGRERSVNKHGILLHDRNGSAPLCIGYSEINKYAIQIYEKQFKHKNYGDITTIQTKQLPDFDLLVGGFPCQSFSIAGKRKGFDDTRGTLFFDIVRILRAKRPKLIVLENVKGLLSSKTMLTLEDILDILFIELTIKQNICQTNFTPIKSWEIVTNNLSIYLQSIGKTNGLQEKWKSLHEKILPIIKKLSCSQEELMQVLELSVEEWDSSLKWLSSKENLTMVDTDTLERTVNMLGDVGWLLKKHLEGSLKNQKLSIILTEISKTTDLKIYLYAIQEMSIIAFIGKQWKLSTNLWKKIESNLIKKLKDTYYVKTFNIILHELRELGYNIEYQILNSKNFGVPQNRERVFIIGHIGKGSRPKVFPIETNTGEITKSVKRKVIKSSARGFGASGSLVDKDDITPTLTQSMGTGGNNVPMVQPVLTPDRLNKRQKGRRFKEDGDPSFTITAQDRHGVALINKDKLYAMRWQRTEKGKKARRESKEQGRDYTPFSDGHRELIPVKDKPVGALTAQAIAKDSLLGNDTQIRRLTPTECERLQGFPDGWTEGVSDTQRYKTLGNAVTVNVIKAIMERLLL